MSNLAKSREIDFALAVIEAVRHEHNITDPMTCVEIAGVVRALVRVDCSTQAIWKIEQKALGKLRRKLNGEGIRGIGDFTDNFSPTGSTYVSAARANADPLHRAPSAAPK